MEVSPMSLTDNTPALLRHADRFFIGGEWAEPSSDAKIDVIDSDTEQVFFSVAEAQAADISRAVEAARQAFDSGPGLHPAFHDRIAPHRQLHPIRMIGTGLSG
jgi:hypothetical protein